MAALSISLVGSGPETHRSNVRGVFPIFVKGEAGFMDAAGMVLIEPKFLCSCFQAKTYPKWTDSASGLQLIPVHEIRGKWGYLTIHGRWQIKPRFDEAWDFTEGLARVRVGSLWGYIEQSGRFQVKPQFESASYFSDGLAAVSSGGPYGYIDHNGKMVIPPRFQTASDFMERVASVSIRSPKGYGFIDKNGTLVIAPSFSFASPFSDGVARTGGHGQWKFIDHSGRVLNEQMYYEAGDFREGLAPVSLDGKTYGFIDHNFQWVIEPHYDGAASFSEGLAGIELNGKYGYVDRTGTVLFWFGPEYTGTNPFRGGLAFIETEHAEGDGISGYLNTKGKFVWGPK